MKEEIIEKLRMIEDDWDWRGVNKLSVNFLYNYK